MKKATFIICALLLLAGCIETPEEWCYICTTYDVINDSTVLNTYEFVGTEQDALFYESENTFRWEKYDKETGELVDAKEEFTECKFCE